MCTTASGPSALPVRAQALLLDPAAARVVMLRVTAVSPFSRHATGAPAAAAVTAVRSPSKASQGSHAQSQQRAGRDSATMSRAALLGVPPRRSGGEARPTHLVDRRLTCPVGASQPPRGHGPRRGGP
eukprot:scaffold121301_cov63-Phaeocystis_antarctica.AAC.2